MLIFDSKDTFYLIARAAFFGLTILPILCGLLLVSIPTMYVAAGTVIGLLAPGLPFVDPLLGATTRLAVEHLTDQIVTWRLPVQASRWTGLPYGQSGGTLGCCSWASCS